MSLGWLMIFALAAVIAVAGFIIITDGRYFGKWLSFWVYDRFGATIFSAERETERWHTLARNIGLQGDERILDIGTAIGDLPRSLASLPGFSGQIVGIDWSPRMIAAAQTAAETAGVSDHVEFQTVDVRQGLPFADGEFDVVFCFGLLETVSAPEKLLADMVRVLSPGGKLAVSVYKGWSLTQTALRAEWYRAQLSPLGMVSLRIVPCRRSQDVLVAEKSV